MEDVVGSRNLEFLILIYLSVFSSLKNVPQMETVHLGSIASLAHKGLKGLDV